MGGAFENVDCAGEECLELREEMEHVSEKQEVLATPMKGKMSAEKSLLQIFRGRLSRS